MINAESNILVTGEDTVHCYFRCLVHTGFRSYLFIDPLDAPKDLVDRFNTFEGFMEDDSIYIDYL